MSPLVRDEPVDREGSEEADQENADRGIQPKVAVVRIIEKVQHFVFRDVVHRERDELGRNRDREDLHGRMNVDDRFCRGLESR